MVSQYNNLEDPIAAVDHLSGLMKEKGKKGVITEYRCVRLEEWEQDNKIHRNWTYINSAPVGGPKNGTKKAARTRSPLVRQLKQQRVLNQELRDMMEEEKRRQKVEKSGSSTNHTETSSANSLSESLTNTLTNSARGTVDSKKTCSIGNLRQAISEDDNLRKQWRKTVNSVDEANMNVRACNALAGEPILPGVTELARRMERINNMIKKIDEVLRTKK